MDILFIGSIGYVSSTKLICIFKIGIGINLCNRWDESSSSNCRADKYCEAVKNSVSMENNLS